MSADVSVGTEILACAFGGKFILVTPPVVVELVKGK